MLIYDGCHLLTLDEVFNKLQIIVGTSKGKGKVNEIVDYLIVKNTFADSSTIMAYILVKYKIDTINFNKFHIFISDPFHKLDKK